MAGVLSKQQRWKMSEKYYCAMAEARAKLEDRQRSGAKDKVVEFWHRQNLPLPTLPTVERPAVLARQVATGRFEDILFRELALGGGLTPTWWEYTADKFASVSPYKRNLMHPVCVRKTQKGLHQQTKKLGQPHQWEKRPLKEVVSKEGVSLVEWHHQRRDEILGPSVVVDVPGYAYPLFLSLFVAHAVLFEDYHGGESGDELDGFTKRRFEPSWQKVADELGMEPLIVRMPWWPELALYPETQDWRQYGIIK